jgi:hypothetical protein
MIPSAINLWSSNWKAYGSPKEEFPLKDVVKEFAHHWYTYPHEQLKDLPKDRYCIVHFQDLVENPKNEILRIYQEFGLCMTNEFLEILELETIKSKTYISDNHYVLEDMDQTVQGLINEFAPSLETYSRIVTDKEPSYSTN